MGETLVGFTQKSAQRIAEAVRGYEAQSQPGSSLRGARRSRGGDDAIASDYDGPFAVSANDATGVLVKAGFIYLGATLVVFAQKIRAISGTTYIYLKITYSSGGYVIELSDDENMPSQTATEWYVPLAYVTYANSAITQIYQHQYGPIHGADGRIV